MIHEDILFYLQGKVCPFDNQSAGPLINDAKHMILSPEMKPISTDTLISLCVTQKHIDTCHDTWDFFFNLHVTL